MSINWVRCPPDCDIKETEPGTPLNAAKENAIPISALNGPKQLGPIIFVSEPFMIFLISNSNSFPLGSPVSEKPEAKTITQRIFFWTHSLITGAIKFVFTDT